MRCSRYDYLYYYLAISSDYRLMVFLGFKYILLVPKRELQTRC